MRFISRHSGRRMLRPLAALRFGSRAPLMLLFLLALAGCQHRAPGGERLYVSDERGDTVVAIDPATGGVTDTIPAGRRPRGLALSPDSATLYVALSGSPVGDADDRPADRKADGIAVIDLATAKVGRVLPAGIDPATVIVSRDGQTLYAADAEGNAVSKVAADGSRAPLTAKVGEAPEGIVLRGDGKVLFVACNGSGQVMMLDTGSLRPVHKIKFKGGPRGLAASRDGKQIYVSLESSGKIAILSAADGKLGKVLDLARGDKEIRPMGMVEAPDGHLFVTTGRYGAVLEVDPQGGTIVRTIEHVGARPWGIALTADGTTLVTANGASGDVSLISRASGKIIRKLNAGVGPWAVAGGAR